MGGVGVREGTASLLREEKGAYWGNPGILKPRPRR